MQRRFVMASAIAVVLTAAFLPGSGFGSSAASARGVRAVPDGLVSAIHARFGDARIRLVSAPPAQPEMGLRVALSADGTTALVAAPGVDGESGAVYVYHAASAGAWSSSSTPMATLKSPSKHGAFGDRLLLSADGTTAFVGAPFHDDGVGAAFVFHVADEASWASTSTPTATLTVNDDGFFFGGAMSAASDGTTLIVGAPDSNGGSGVAYIFHVAAEDAWVSTSTPTAVLSNAAASSDQGVGDVVAISGDGDTALLSDTDASNYAGAADLFHVASESAWATTSTPTAVLSNASDVPDNEFGASSALSGDGTTAFVDDFGVHNARGAVDVFHVATADAWASTALPTAILTNANGAKHDGLGGIVRASTDGMTIVASATGAAKLAGAVDVFHASAEDAWTTTSTPAATLVEPKRAPGDLLGYGAAISADGTTALGGAPGFDWYTGHAFVYHVADAGSWSSGSLAAKLTNSALPKPHCIVPRLKGEPVEFAKFDLAISDCRLGKVGKVHVKSKRMRGLIVSQSPAPGRHRPAGWKIKVKVGK